MVAVGGGIVLTVCALVAERMCIAPPGDDDDRDDPRERFDDGELTRAHPRRPAMPRERLDEPGLGLTGIDWTRVSAEARVDRTHHDRS